MEIRKEVERGVPKRSVIGLTLWNVVMAGYLNLELGKDNEPFACADDGVIFIKGNSRRILERRAEMALETVAES